MNKRPLISICALFICSLAVSASAAELDLTNKEQRQSYAIGINFGENLKRQGIEIEPESFLVGVKDVLTGAKKKLTEAELTQVINELSQELRAKQTTQISEQGEENQAKGEAYLAKNKTKEGVKVTASGLQYKAIIMGDGPKPKLTDTVKVHYEGTLINGKEIDSSYKRQNPATFQLTGVIKGWTEVLQLMPVGSKFEVAIPGALAYGENAPPAIGPNQVLLFQIELLSIE